MMKLLTGLVVVIALTSSTCNKAEQSKTCFKARLEVKGICMNYTFSLLEGDTTVVKVAPKWQDENTGKTYYKAFTLSNPCGFADLKEGEEFYFMLDADPQMDCATCKAYYPTPPARNNIKVVAQCP